MRARHLMILAGLLTAQAYDVWGAGSTAAALLRLGIGAKNAAMGETGAAGRDIFAAYWNPAGLAGIAGRSASFMHAAWLADVSVQNAIYAQRLGGGGIAVSGTYLSMPSIDKYDNTGLRQNDSYQPSDAVLGISYAQPFDGVPAGATLKYIASQIDGHTASATALDVGVQLEPVTFAGKALRVGVAVQNLGTKMKFVRESFGLPLTLRAGAQYSFTGRLSGVIDLNKPVDADVAGNAGIEYSYSYGKQTFLAARAGYRSNGAGLGGLAGLTAGLGFGYQGVQLDYAFVPYGDLDNTHRVSLILNF